MQTSQKRSGPVEMMDRLVRLYDLPEIQPFRARMREQGVSLRRPRAYEKNLVVQWVRDHFSNGWAGECEVTFAREPVSSFIATHEANIVGFASYESTHKNFFGPIGVRSDYRSRGIGAALLLSSLWAMSELGYAYAVIGGAREAADFYRNLVGAIDIPGSNPGIYIDRLRSSDS